MTDYNATKYRIFNIMSRLNRPVTAADLVFNIGITECNAWKRLSVMYGQGYLLKKGRGRYTLGKKGTRVLGKLRRLRDISKITGQDISLNLKKSVPSDIMAEYAKKSCTLAQGL